MRTTDADRASFYARRAGAYCGMLDALIWGVKDGLRFIDSDPEIAKMLLESILNVVERSRNVAEVSSWSTPS